MVGDGTGCEQVAIGSSCELLGHVADMLADRRAPPSPDSASCWPG
ncbi:hypothetical protein STRIP9103_03298 [Streptomyces ipomoeae 91-03]|uniref:Uncharacterized protein n=1 Tax=Streptomyces ipomoeae 91-03 TaxID=698759 RepID=L1KTM8_9ACTN|nr:hypothetical protein STRIP9103_03298 [Streptomyces ipomoeae 91-03]